MSSADDRRITQLRFNITCELTRTINRAKYILRRLNIEQHCPTKGIQAQRAKVWLKTLTLPPLDRFEMDQPRRWSTLSTQRDQIDRRIAERRRWRRTCNCCGPSRASVAIRRWH